MDRFGNRFGAGHGCGVDRCSSPSDIERHTRKVNNAAIAAVTTQIVGRAHEDAIDRAWLDAQSTEHTLRVIDRIAGDLEALAPFNFFLADVNTIDGARFGALVARDAGREIEAVKTSIPGRDRDRQFRVLKMLGKRLPFGPIRFDPGTERNPHTMDDGGDGLNHIP